MLYKYEVDKSYKEFSPILLKLQMDEKIQGEMFFGAFYQNEDEKPIYFFCKEDVLRGEPYASPMSQERYEMLKMEIKERLWQTFGFQNIIR